MVGIFHFLVVGALLFSIGVVGVLVRRNLIAILMSIELIFNGSALNLVAFNKFLYHLSSTGQAIVIFIITVAAAEAVIGLALIFAIYRNFKNIHTDNLNLLKG